MCEGVDVRCACMAHIMATIILIKINVCLIPFRLFSVDVSNFLSKLNKHILIKLNMTRARVHVCVCGETCGGRCISAANMMDGRWRPFTYVIRCHAIECENANHKFS